MISRSTLLASVMILSATAGAAAERTSSRDVVGAEQAYQGARKDYYALKGDTARRRLRHHWLNVANKFEAVASKFPQSERAPDALFTAAELLEELSRISMLDEDLRGAVADYTKLLDQHAHHRLADDAALALGKIEADRLGDPEAARKVLARGIEQTPTGDKIRALKSLYASLADAARKATKKHSVPTPAVAPAQPKVGLALAEAVVKAASTPRLENAALATATRGPNPEDEEDDDEDQPANLETPTEASRPVDPKLRLRSVVQPKGSEITLAEQLGLKVRKVVIDAGHGGHDSGALGVTGTKEKDVSLAIAKRLSEILTQAGLEVILTRDDDTFVRLEDRAKIANDAHGDLFVSIHCNSGPSKKMKGIETYTLNTSSNRYSIRLAARENSSSEKGISDLQFILADLATKANTEESTRLAARVQKSVAGRLAAKYPSVRDLGNKEALFYVLLGAKMPAVLVETSFLSNPEEEKRLASSAYQEEIAQAIGAGVQDFLGNRQRLAKVDSLP